MMTKFLFEEEETGKNPIAKLLSDQMLGYVCELVLIDVINGKSAPNDLSTWGAEHQALTNSWNTVVAMQSSRSKAEREQANDCIAAITAFTKKAFAVTKAVLSTSVKRVGSKKILTNRDLVGDSVNSSAAGGTSAFDVETPKANLHVKLNQSGVNQRVIGFGEGTKFNEKYFKNIQPVMMDPDVVRSALKYILKDGTNKKMNNISAAKKAYDAFTFNGFPRKPESLHGTPPAAHPFSIVKRAVKLAFKDNVDKLTKLKFGPQLRADLDQRLFSQTEGKTTAFVKYTCDKTREGYPEVSTLQVEFDVYVFPKDVILKLKFISPANKQPYGIVWNPNHPAGESQPLFFIEIRTDGEGHPPQLKIGDPIQLKELAQYKVVKTKV